MSCINDFINLNNYIKLAEIHYGSFYIISEIQEKNTGNKYIAKISYKKIFKFSQSEIIYFSQEVDRLSQITHPSILKFIGYSPVDFVNQPKPLIITEYASNKSLEDVLQLERKGKSLLTDTNKLIIIYGIASAMSYLHSHNILHRDIKPEHILLDDKFHPKLTGFILSKQISDVSRPVLVGTPAYLAPEIIKKKMYSKSSDVYAFSMVIYEILTNERPFQNFSDLYSIFEIIESTENYRPSFKKSIPKSYQKLIESCWSQKVENRPSFDKIIEIFESDSNFLTEKLT